MCVRHPGTMGHRGAPQGTRRPALSTEQVNSRAVEREAG